MSDPAATGTSPSAMSPSAMSPSELLQRISGTLRNDVGPAVGDEYTRTQAFMASVILERVSKQVALAPAHSAAEQADMTTLIPALEGVLTGAPAEVETALASTSGAGTVDSLGALIDALYQWGVGEPAVDEALGLVRPVLRHDIDRRMEIAK